MIWDLAGVVALLTRLPVGKLAAGAAPARGVWGWPVVGGAIGGAGAAAYAIGHAIGLAAPLAAVWTLVTLLLLTGALHEDGLADTADACAGGRTREQRLSIMRDSRIGSFGALALLLSSAVRVAAIAALPPGAAAAGLIASGALGRAAMLVPLLRLPPARTDGLGARLDGAAAGVAALGLALGAAVALAALPPGAAVPAIGCALVAGGGVAWLARRLVGGYTGDVFGATSVIAECLVLSWLSTRSG